ncbi:hypothetical protein CL622_00220 [archaeon]|nr:hypothetical protein [archaeon]|tara:strand:- start:662 stop:1465 length:804 start_codon:yes stop_codon:yes gene_type:complete
MSRGKSYHHPLLGTFMEDIGLDVTIPNPEFKSYHGLFETIRKKSCYDEEFPHGKYAKLMRAVQEHRGAHVEIGDKSVLLMTHPFFPVLVHSDVIEENGRLDQVTHYMQKMTLLFQRIKSVSNLDLVLLESAEDYGYVSSILKDNGFVRDVYFTFFDRGFLHEKESYIHLEKSSLVSRAGVYSGEGCLGESIDDSGLWIDLSMQQLVPDLTLPKPRLIENKNNDELASFQFDWPEPIKSDRAWAWGLKNLHDKIPTIIYLDQLLEKFS